jgi:sugar phosphate isomerase/epimerase
MSSKDERWDPRLCVNSLSSQHWTLWEDLECYERLGIGRISLFMPKLLSAGLDRAVAEIRGRGIRVDGILPGSTFDLLREESWSRTQDALVMGIEVARRLGATTVQTPGGSAGGSPYEVAVECFTRAVGPVAAVAASAGVRLALEPTRPQFAHIGFVHTVRDALALATELGLWVVPDTAHCWWEPDVAGLLAHAASRVAVVQVADLAFGAPVLERLVPGDGALPLGRLLAATLAAGFPGPFELEILGSAIESEGYEGAIQRSLAYLTALLAGPDRALVG